MSALQEEEEEEEEEDDLAVLSSDAWLDADRDKYAEDAHGSDILLLLLLSALNGAYLIMALLPCTPRRKSLPRVFVVVVADVAECVQTAWLF